MLKIEFLPAAHGDCILMSYGDPAAPRWVLIDGGPSHTYDSLTDRLAEAEISRFEAMVVTHIDADHIDGLIRLIQDTRFTFEIGDFWFNGRDHLDQAVLGRRRSDISQLGGVDGEILGMLLEDLEIPWNVAFDGGPIVVDNDEQEPLPVIYLDGGLKLTLMSPTVKEVSRLRKAWDKTVRNAGFEPGDIDKAREVLERRKRLQPPTQLGTRDSSVANGSSIGFLVEYEGASALLVGDAFHQVINRSLRRLRTERGLQDWIELDAWKLGHHGSRNNCDPAMLRRARCTNFVISTNGDRFKHPDQQAIDMLAEVPDAELWFNYRSPTTECFADDPKWDGRVHFPPEGEPLTFEF